MDLTGRSRRGSRRSDAAAQPAGAPCPDCHAIVPEIEGPTHPYLGASAGCWSLWGEVQAASATDRALAAVLPLAVDAYAAQHPGRRGRREAQSVSVHLASICLALEHGWTPQEGIRAKQILLAHDPIFEWLEPPADPGAVTVVDLARIGGGEPGLVVRRWAAAVWDAWSDHHASIRHLVGPIAAGPRRRTP
jgi:hypothetical protein